MLKEIFCDKFRSHGKQRPPIKFHKGLNTVLGDREGTNSIGKSTLLLIIDFAFGGDDYLNCNALTYVGDHTIYFTFTDSADNEYYFCRKTNEKQKAYICDRNRCELEGISIEDYRKKLAKIHNVDISFRTAISLYLRIYGRDNHNEHKPLHLFGSQSASDAITQLQQLFGESQLVKDRKAEEKKCKTTRDAYRAASKENLITIPTAKAAKEVQKQIDALQAELSQLIADTDKKANDIDSAQSHEAAAIKQKLRILRRNRTILRTQMENVTFNLNGGTSVTTNDLDDLAHFFPGVNIRELQDIEHFHITLQSVLKAECKQEATRLNDLLASINAEIEDLEYQYRKTGVPVTLSSAFLNKHAELSIQIKELTDQIQRCDNMKQYEDAWKSAKKLLAEAQQQELPTIARALNAQMVRYSDYVMGDDKEAPSIDLNSGKNYTFGTSSDDGTGNNYKNLILFDMSVLALTQLPAVIHDSFILKDIGDASIEKIISLYQQSQKQVFISLDKASSYRDTTAQALDETQVIYLMRKLMYVMLLIRCLPLVEIECCLSKVHVRLLPETLSRIFKANIHPGTSCLESSHISISLLQTWDLLKQSTVKNLFVLSFRPLEIPSSKKKP